MNTPTSTRTCTCGETVNRYRGQSAVTCRRCDQPYSDTTEPGDLLPAQGRELLIPIRILDRRYREEGDMPTPVSGDAIARRG